MKKKIISYLYCLILIFTFSSGICPLKCHATTVEDVDEEDEQIEVTVGSDDDGNVTVTYGKYVFTRKYNGWYIPSAYIYDGSELDNFLDSVIAGTRRTSVRCDGFLYVKMSGGWYRHELHFNDGRWLAEQFNQAAGITTTYNPDNITTDNNQ